MKRRLVAWDEAMRIAEAIVNRLRDGCERIEIAGALRRRTGAREIALVAIPKLVEERDLFKNIVSQRSLLDDLLAGWRMSSNLAQHKRFTVEDWPVGLRVASAATWGVDFVRQTGSADFVRWLFTPQALGGAAPEGMYARDGRLWRGLQALETPEERDVFRALRVAWVPPERRAAGQWGRGFSYSEG